MKQDAPNFYNLRGMYTNGLITDYDLRKVISATPDLTLNPWRTSGFNEIDVRLPTFRYDDGKTGGPFGIMTQPLNQILLDGLISRLTKLNSKRDIWMGLSAGKDTRILLRLLQKLKLDGRFDTDRIQFIAYEPEHIYAKVILEECGFSDTNLYIYRRRSHNLPDYYRLAEPGFNPNGCFSPEIEYFDDVDDKPFDYSNKVLIWGSGGNELTFYPSSRHTYQNSLPQFLAWTYGVRGQHYEKYHKWGEVIEPYLYMPYMNAAFNLPPQAFMEYDGVRDRMLKELGGTKIPCIKGHNYNYKFTKETVQRIHDQFVNSQFAQRFDISRYQHQLPNMIGQIKQIQSIEMKVLGLAMVYEGCAP